MAAYIDTSALAKWYLNESRSDDFEAYLREVDRPTISSLTVVEVRSLLSRHRRMGHLSAEKEQEIFDQFQQDLEERLISLLPCATRMRWPQPISWAAWPTILSAPSTRFT